MRTKILTMMYTTKKKVGVAILCGVFATSIFAGTAFAEDSKTSLMQGKVENVTISFSTNEGNNLTNNTTLVEVTESGTKDGKFHIIKGVPAISASVIGLMCKEENGVKSYSTDGGKTWSEKVPDGVTVSEDGMVTMMKPTLAESDYGMRVLSKIEDGIESFSTDGGKTWSEKAPDGLVAIEAIAADFCIATAFHPVEGDMVDLICKEENGIKSYSTDGGKTWSEMAPDSLKEIETKVAKFGITKAFQLKDADGMGIMIKEENGIKNYSTDGGKTWSEIAPAGVTLPKGGAIRIKGFQNKATN